MDWVGTLKTLAPTVATALGGPLAGAAVTAIGAVLGVPDATQDKIADVLRNGQMTPEQVSKLRELELQYQNDEKDRGFRYAELAFKDRDSARQASVQGGTQKMLFWLSLVLLVTSIGAEIRVLFYGVPAEADPLIVGRVLGLLDSVALLVLNYWYGSSSGSANKTELLNAAPKK